MTELSEISTSRVGDSKGEVVRFSVGGIGGESPQY